MTVMRGPVLGLFRGQLACRLGDVYDPAGWSR